jgi:hypothetical protein
VAHAFDRTWSADQADRRWRPLSRRARRTRRPALVDMRCRKPWRLARRRLFGWNVRFTSCLLDRPDPCRSRRRSHAACRRRRAGE